MTSTPNGPYPRLDEDARLEAVEAEDQADRQERYAEAYAERFGRRPAK